MECSIKKQYILFVQYATVKVICFFLTQFSHRKAPTTAISSLKQYKKPFNIVVLTFFKYKVKMPLLIYLYG